MKLPLSEVLLRRGSDQDRTMTGVGRSLHLKGANERPLTQAVLT